MKLNKKAFAIMELLLYIFIIALVGLSTSMMMSTIVAKLDIKKQRNIFFKNYNNFVSDLLQDNEKWWKLYSIVLSWIIMKNNKNYLWYGCEKNGIYKTNISNSSWNINWDIKQNYYSWFKCNQLTWKTNVYSWYWIKVNILDDTTYKYFLKN